MRKQAQTPAQRRDADRLRQIMDGERARCAAALTECFAAVDRVQDDRKYIATAAEVLGRSQIRHVVNLRRAIAYTLNRRKGWEFSTPVIGVALNRDHTSIIHLVQTAEACLDRCANPYCVQSVNLIRAIEAGLDAREGRG